VVFPMIEDCLPEAALAWTRRGGGYDWSGPRSE